MNMRALDLVVVFAAGLAVGLLLCALLDEVERKESECHSPSPS